MWPWVRVWVGLGGDVGGAMAVSIIPMFDFYRELSSMTLS